MNGFKSRGTTTVGYDIYWSCELPFRELLLRELLFVNCLFVNIVGQK